MQAFAGEDVRIIYCDDDEYYSPQWAQTLIQGSDEHPHDCITIMGNLVSLIRRAAFVRSRPFRALNICTLDLYRRFYRSKNPDIRPGIGPVDICQGFSGTLVRPEFFGPEVFDIPDLLWTVDDVWLSGQLAARGVTIRQVSAKKMCNKTEWASVDALTHYKHDNHDRTAADLACVEYFSRNYGIWR